VENKTQNRKSSIDYRNKNAFETMTDNTCPFNARKEKHMGYSSIPADSKQQI